VNYEESEAVDLSVVNELAERGEWKFRKDSCGRSVNLWN
jgi:hypothetical protein